VKVTIRKVGNSLGIIIPKAMLALTGIGDEAEIRVEKGAIVLRKPRNAARPGWAKASRNIAAAGDDTLAWPVFGNESDAELEWS